MSFYPKIRKALKNELIKKGYFTKPSFLIIGAQKAGTTYLYSILKNHPEIIEPGWKEIHFFDIDNNYFKGSNWYYSKFFLPYKTKNKITFEATPDYFSNKKVPARIKTFFDEIKLVLILRDPVKRAYSAWNMHHYLFKDHIFHSDLYDPRSFEQAIYEELENGPIYYDGRDYLEYGKYDKHLKRFLKYFNLINFFIIDWTNLITDEKKTLTNLYDFLAIKPYTYQESMKRQSEFWSNKGTYNSNMKREMNALLSDFYYDYNKNLQSLLGRRFSWMP